MAILPRSRQTPDQMLELARAGFRTAKHRWHHVENMAGTANGRRHKKSAVAGAFPDCGPE
jgi:hypothetical protein